LFASASALVSPRTKCVPKTVSFRSNGPRVAVTITRASPRSCSTKSPLALAEFTNTTVCRANPVSQSA
jgi:hypothetical protein